MRIAPAGRDDLANLIAFRDEAARWLAARGIEQWSEPWPSEDLMVKGMLRNLKAGETFIDWAGTRAADEGARWLRVDVWTTNDKLQQYYRDQGFTHVRTVVLPHNPSGAVFQRPARRARTP